MSISLLEALKRAQRSSQDDLKAAQPYADGRWDAEKLIAYLIWCHYIDWEAYIDEFFSCHIDDPALADLLFAIVLDEDFDGSDARMGAAYYISKLSEDRLKERKDLLLAAEQNEVAACRPLTYSRKQYEWM